MELSDKVMCDDKLTYGEMLDSIYGSKSSKLTSLSLQARFNVVFNNRPLNQTQFDIFVSPCKIFFYMRSQRVHSNTLKRNILSKVIENPFQTHFYFNIYLFTPLSYITSDALFFFFGMQIDISKSNKIYCYELFSEVYLPFP